MGVGRGRSIPTRDFTFVTNLMAGRRYKNMMILVEYGREGSV